MKDKQEQKVGFWKWFLAKKWIGIPLWIWIVFGSFGNSAKLVSSDPNYPISGVVADALGGIVFVLIIFVVWFYLVAKKRTTKT